MLTLAGDSRLAQEANTSCHQRRDKHKRYFIRGVEQLLRRHRNIEKLLAYARNYGKNYAYVASASSGANSLVQVRSARVL